MKVAGKELRKQVLELIKKSWPIHISGICRELDFKENVIFSGGAPVISDLVQKCKKYVPPYPLGAIDMALMTIGVIDLEEFEEK